MSESANGATGYGGEQTGDEVIAVADLWYNNAIARQGRGNLGDRSCQIS
jgi:hypothetical protein